MGKDKIRVAIIGVGIIGESHIQTYQKIPEAEIAAICDIDEARLNEVGDATNTKIHIMHEDIFNSMHRI